MKFAKCSSLYSVRCSLYSNSYQESWDSFKFINDKNFNGNTFSNTLKYLIFIFAFIFNLLNEIGNKTKKKLYGNREMTK